MQFAAAIIVVAILAAVILAAPRGMRSMGWLMILFACLPLAHAGVTIFLIISRHGLDPGYRWMNYWMLFATIPTGLLLLFAGGVTLAVESCSRRSRRRGFEIPASNQL